MFKKIVLYGMVVVFILTATSCRSTKNQDSAYSQYEEILAESDLGTTVSDTSSENSSSKNSVDSKSSTNKNSSEKTSNSSKDTGTNKHTHTYAEATCTEPEKCTVCGATNGKPAGHSFHYGSCIFCNALQDNYLRYHPFKEISITLDELNKIFTQKYTKPKNIIIMIGDGMGPNDITISEKFSDDLYDFGLAFNKIPNQGYAITDSLDGTTDSAASATALATGFKTKNQRVGVDKDGNKLTNISEIAREYGKKVGVVTNDGHLGATPSAFIAHSDNRGNGNELLISALTFAPDVYVGVRSTEYENIVPHLLEKFLISHQLTSLNEILNSDPKATKPYIGYYQNGYVDSLQMYTQIALDRLKNDKGFFLMVENTLADHAGHSSDMEGKISAIPVLDKAVVTVLNFMKNNPDTLLIVTSDHETGGVQLPKDGEKPTDSLFTSNGSHTSTHVKVFALGYGAEYFNGKTVDNTDIAKFAINAVKGN